MNMQVNASQQSLSQLAQPTQKNLNVATPAGAPEQASSLEKDLVSVQRGVLPTLKGAGAGGLGAGATAVALFAATGGFKGEGAIVAVPLSLGAAIGGAMGGATSANVTTSKWKGALAGAVGGAVGAGAWMGLSSKNLGAAASGALIGGITGAVGGVFGAMVAKNN